MTMKIAIAISGEDVAPLIKNRIAAEIPEAEFTRLCADSLPADGGYHAVIADKDALLAVHASEKLRAAYMSEEPRAFIVSVNGRQEIYFKLYSERGLRLLGETFGSGSGDSVTVPLFYSLDDVSAENGAPDYMLYPDPTGEGKRFAVRHGCDTIIAEYADKAPSGSKVIASVGGKRTVARFRIVGDGISLDGKRYSFEDCDSLPVLLIARVRKVLKGRN